MIGVLFVCLGNICRSPAAEGILLQMSKDAGVADRLKIASCGLGDWFVGQQPDERMMALLALRGIVLTSRCQQFHMGHFQQFDYILAADQQVLRSMQEKAQTTEDKEKITLITAFSKQFRHQDVPDPYFGGAGGFEHVVNILEDACEGLLIDIQGRLRAKN